MEALRLFTPDSDKVIRIQARRHQRRMVRRRRCERPEAIGTPIAFD